MIGINVILWCIKKDGINKIMKTTKIIAFIAALSLTGVMLTACGSDKPEETTTVAETEAVTEETTADTSAEAPAEESTEEATDEITEGDEVVGDEAANPLQPLVDAALASGEWPALMEVTDAALISDYFTIDVTDANIEEYIVMQCPMSANLSEIIIIKSADVDSAKAALEGRQKKAQETDAFYPGDVERAGSSIVGTEGSYAYFIMADGSADAETALVEAIKAL